MINNKLYRIRLKFHSGDKTIDLDLYSGFNTLNKAKGWGQKKAAELNQQKDIVRCMIMNDYYVIFDNAVQVDEIEGIKICKNFCQLEKEMMKEVNSE